MTDEYKTLPAYNTISYSASAVCLFHSFQVEDKRRGLDLSQLRTAVRHMAHLHAVSFAFNRTHDFLTKYSDFKHNPITSSIMGVIARIVIEGLQGTLEGRGDEFPGLLEALTSNKNALIGKMTDALNVSGKEAVLCLCHGDFWTNNIMFKYDEGGAVEDFAMIDWGNVAWRSPVVDLQYLIHTSTQKDLRRDHLKEIQMLYYDTFTSAAADLGAPLLHWGFGDFLTEWQRTAVAGLALGILVNLVTLSEFGRKFQRGTLSKGFISWLKTKFGNVIASIPGSLLVKFSYAGLKTEWKTYFDEFASMNNPEMTTRVMDLVVEAHRAGVLDP